MSLAVYIRSIAGELVLLFFCVWALEMLVMDGFYVDASLQFGPLPALVSAVLLIAAYAAAFKQRFLLAGGVIVGALVVGVIAAAMAFSGSADAYADVYGNLFWAAVVVVVVTMAGFLLTRTLGGAGFWFAGCVFVAALVQMLFRTGRLWLSLLVLFTSLALLVFRNFRIGQASVDSASGVSNLANFAVATVPLALLIGVACAVWFAIIAPMNPGVVDAHLITEYRKENVEQVRGVGNVQMEVDTSMTSDELVDGERFTTDDLKVDPNADKAVEAKAAQTAGTASQSELSDESGGAGSAGESAGERDTLDRQSPERQFDPISYTEHRAPFQVLLIGLSLILLLLLAYFLVRRYRRRRRQGNPRDQMSEIYLFLVGKLARIGFPVPPGATLADYSHSTKARMETMRNETRVPFSYLTETYAKTAYAAHEPSEEELAAFVAYYQHFWKAARKHLGNVRYFFKSFRLG